MQTQSREVKKCYALFEDNLGKSDERFSAAFVDPTKCLRLINDVPDELTSIKRVFQDQLEVWKKVHSGDKGCIICYGWDIKHEDEHEEKAKREDQSEGERRRQGEEMSTTCASEPMPKRSLELTLRLEEDALKVRESASICSVASPADCVQR